MNFDSITVALDMRGCPNRCKHCWIGHAPNAHLTAADLRYAAGQFRPYTDRLTVDDWYREPDFSDDYRQLWALCNSLSDAHPPHFELISVWRAVRDAGYVPWLASIGLQTAQLTLFGGEAATDYYTGRRGAYQDILQTIQLLLDHRIAPRLQVFVNKDNIDQLPLVEQLIRQLELEARCQTFGGQFACFVHQGSCDGENAKLYDRWVTPEDLAKIPPMLADHTLRHWGKNDLRAVFGQPEQRLYQTLCADNTTASYVTNDPVFYIDADWNVYPNITTPSAAWRLGNLQADGVETVLQNYLDSKSPAQHARATVPLCQMAAAAGDAASQRLFTKGDYIIYLLNRFCSR